MKKTLFSLCLCLALFSTTFINTGCGDGCDEDDVAQKAEAYVEASLTYALSPTDENCEALKSTSEAYLDAVDGCDDVSESEVQAVRDSFNDLGC